jgi:hypothetical protein
MTSSRRNKALSPISSGSHALAAAAAQAGMQPHSVSVTTAAAVMAAVAAVGASLVAGDAAPAAGSQQHGSLINTAGAPAVAPSVVPRNLSSILQGQGAASATAAGTGDAVPPAPSFLAALMAGGGVIHPPNGPPIPLNVDFGSEVALGPLLGRGGFGHVYEASWRGQKVSDRGGAGADSC